MYVVGKCSQVPWLQPLKAPMVLVTVILGNEVKPIPIPFWNGEITGTVATIVLVAELAVATPPWESVAVTLQNRLSPGWRSSTVYAKPVAT